MMLSEEEKSKLNKNEIIITDKYVIMSKDKLEKINYFTSNEFLNFIKSLKVKYQIKEVISLIWYLVIFFGVLKIVPIIGEIQKTIQGLLEKL